VDASDWIPAATAAIADLVSGEFEKAVAELLAANVTPPAGEMAGTEEPVP